MKTIFQWNESECVWWENYLNLSVLLAMGCKKELFVSARPWLQRLWVYSHGQDNNLMYGMVNFRAFEAAGIHANIWLVNSDWLYSLYWCTGISSVTSDFAHTLPLSSPVWTMVSVSIHLAKQYLCLKQDTSVCHGHSEWVKNRRGRQSWLCY